MKFPSSLLLLLSLFAAAPAAAVANLHDALPDDAVAYLRLAADQPFIGPAADTRLYGALTQADLEARYSGLIGDLARALSGEPEVAAAAPWLDLVARLRAPIEAVALLPAGRQASMANVLVRAGIDAETAADVDALIGAWADAYPALDRVSPLHRGEVGVLNWGGQLPLLYVFDADAKALYLMAGLAADLPSLRHAIASLRPVAGHPMYAIEQRVDSSGRGPFLWLDGGRLVSALSQGVAAGPGAGMVPGLPPGMGAEVAGSVALGWGTRGGKGRLSLVMEAPGAGVAAMLPTIDNRFELSARGRPWLLMSLSLPLPELLQIGEGLLQMNPEAYLEYLGTRAEFERAFGMGFGDLAGILGPEVLVFGDEVGEYAAMRLADAVGLQRFLDSLAGLDGVSYSVRAINGVDYHHLALRSPPESTADSAQGSDPEAAALMSALARVEARARTHLYWVRDGDFLVFAQVPQMLMDRAAAADAVPLDEWLRVEQGQDPRHALLLLSTRIDDIPRRIYYATLQVMEQIGDVTGRELDLYGLEPASRLALPDSGAYGLQLDVSPQWLDLEFTFEANPVEFMLGQNGALIAGVIGAALVIAAAEGEDDSDPSVIGCGQTAEQPATF